MAIQPAICTNCGGRINVEDIDLNGYGECVHCHTPYKVIDVITIDGLPTAKSLLTAATHSMEDGNYEKAVGLFNEIINIKPNCHEAWWGLYTCHAAFDRYYNYEDKYGNRGPLTKAQIMNETLQKYAVRAIDYAPEETAQNYRREIKESQDYIESVRRGNYDTKTSKKSGCYIATAVYGSYECDEVFVLRRFRDDYLTRHFWGRWFIRFYYLVGPCLANQMNPSSKISSLFRRLLNGFISRM